MEAHFCFCWLDIVSWRTILFSIHMLISTLVSYRHCKESIDDLCWNCCFVSLTPLFSCFLTLYNTYTCVCLYFETFPGVSATAMAWDSDTAAGSGSDANMSVEVAEGVYSRRNRGRSTEPIRPEEGDSLLDPPLRTRESARKGIKVCVCHFERAM